MALLQVVVLVSVAAGAVAIGHGYTRARAGDAGVQAMWVAACICLGSSIVAAALVAIVARLQPEYVGQAAFAGTAVRLLLTGMAAGTWQVLHEVHLSSFLGWLTVLYLLLLVVDTAFSVVLVRRHMPSGRVNGS